MAKPRTRNYSGSSSSHKLATEKEAEHAVDNMFDALKDKNGRVPVHKIYHAVQRVGIRLTDPRLRDMMECIKRLQKSVMQDEDNAKGAYFLDRITFKDAVKHNVVMLHRCLEKDFFLPDLSILSDVIDKIYESCRSNTFGTPADHIPQLARFDPDLWGVTVCTVEGQRYSVGDTTHSFCLQSATKPLNYALVHTELGSKKTHDYIGYEPAGGGSNDICLNPENKPHNPMINTGAIITCSLIRQNLDLSDRFDYVLEQYRKLAGGEFIGFSNSTFLSDRAAADRNFALSYFMKENGCFPDGNRLMETLDLYFQLRSVEVTAETGAVIAATLANGGICPLTGERVLSGEAVRDTLSLMYSCGMNDYSGQFAFKVGLPAKSGVSGVVFLVIPNQMGICTWSPPLDKQANSCRGVQLCSELVMYFGCHNFHGMVRNGSSCSDHQIKLGDVGLLPKSETKEHAVVSLLFAAYSSDLTALRRMYLRDVDMSQKDYDGRTALHVAAAEGHLSVVEFLIEICNVPLCPKDRWDFTPLSEAKRFEHNDVWNYLQKRAEISSVKSKVENEELESLTEQVKSTKSESTEKKFANEQMQSIYEH